MRRAAKLSIRLIVEGCSKLAIGECWLRIFGPSSSGAICCAKPFKKGPRVLSPGPLILLLLSRLDVRQVLAEEEPLAIGKHKIPADCSVCSIPGLVRIDNQHCANRDRFLRHAQAD